MTSWQLNQHVDDYYESLKRIKMEDGSSLSQRLKQQDNLYQKKGGKKKAEIEKNDVRQERNSMILSPKNSQG